MFTKGTALILQVFVIFAGVTLGAKLMGQVLATVAPPAATTATS